MRQGKLLLSFFILFRLLNAAVLQTFAEPDEYWQSQEVAHRLAFGSGSLTWEWRVGLRDVAYPYLLSRVWRLFSWAGANPDLLVLVPKYTQAVISALGQYYFVKFCVRVGGDGLLVPAILSTVGSWFDWMYSARTLSNGVETAFASIFCYYWSWPGMPNLPQVRSVLHLHAFCYLLALLSFILRPTASLLFVSVVVDSLFRLAQPTALLLLSVAVGALETTVVCALSAALNYSFYQRWVFPAWTFFEVNALWGVSAFYGTNPWYWYLAAGIPAILGGFLPFFARGLIMQPMRPFLKYLAVVITVYSALQHKEMRFLAGVAPFINLAVALGIAQLGQRRWWRMLLFTVLAVHALVGLYATTVHQRGVIDVTNDLRHRMAGFGNVTGVGFLMPCHSTPLFARLHYDVPVKFLTCEPPLELSERDRLAYRDEARQFYADVRGFVANHFPPVMSRKTPKRTAPQSDQKLRDWFWPSHLVIFESLLDTEFSIFLQGTGYHQCAQHFNSHWHPDSERRGHVLIYCRDPTFTS